MSRTPSTGQLMDLYGAMLAHFGPRHWWPADSPFAVCVGAVLTQNTAWKNVVLAIDNLEAAGRLDPFRILELPISELAELIRPAGYFNVKARRLRNLVQYLVENYQGDLNTMAAGSLDLLRSELLAVKGVGRETADSILLYAVNKPIFVVDAYTKRILERHALIPPRADYDTIQNLFHERLPRDAALYNDYHAQFVAVGHHYCKRQPRCSECPLQPFLDG